MEYKEVNVYYNVDANHWSDTNGDFIDVNSIPELTLYTYVALKITFVHDYGVEVVSFTIGHTYRFVAYYEATKVLESTDVNTEAGLAIWGDADYSVGKFIVLLDCNKVEFETALADYKQFRFDSEFQVIDAGIKRTTFLEQVFGVKAFNDNGEVTTINIGVDMRTVDIAINSEYTTILTDTAVYDISSVIVVMPLDGDIRYSATMVREDTLGYTVFYSSTIRSADYKLKYTLIKK